MNPIIQSLFDRKSCRIFKDKEISQEERKLILEACMQAPSAGNQQMYTIIDVQDLYKIKNCKKHYLKRVTINLLSIKLKWF